MAWKKLPDKDWKRCEVCGDWIRRVWSPTCFAEAMGAGAMRRQACESTGEQRRLHVIWDKLTQKRHLFDHLRAQEHPRSVIDELRREIEELVQAFAGLQRKLGLI